MNVKKSLLTLAASAALLLPAVSRAEPVGHHPAFLHALTDLRDARWNLEHRPGDWAMRADESLAIEEVDHAIAEIHRAAIDDGKNTSLHPPSDARLDRLGRLHHALELLRRAYHDASGEEDNPASREWRHRALEHMDAAIHATERAIHIAER
ncbi:MAG TPA: hypothetical protein VHD32_17605 [Candidatus Didemnitutus sp.]|nr:hypothetical protein [Candidatus Didemnitutus sp.]